jgi:hypothetical protein
MFTYVIKQKNFFRYPYYAMARKAPASRLKPRSAEGVFGRRGSGVTTKADRKKKEETSAQNRPLNPKDGL